MSTVDGTQAQPCALCGGKAHVSGNDVYCQSASCPLGTVALPRVDWNALSAAMFLAKQIERAHAVNPSLVVTVLSLGELK